MNNVRNAHRSVTAVYYSELFSKNKEHLPQIGKLQTGKPQIQMARKKNGKVHTRLKTKATFKRYIPEDCHVMIEINEDVKASPPVPFERVLGIIQLICLDFFSYTKLWTVRILFDDNMGTVRSYKNILGPIALMRRLPVDSEYTRIKAFSLVTDRKNEDPIMSVLTCTDEGTPMVKVNESVAHLVVREIVRLGKANYF